MTLGNVSSSDSSSAVSFCSCCGAKMVPHFSDDAVVTKNQINQLISESFLTVKGAALFLPRGNSPTPNPAPSISQRINKHAGDLQKHLQTMFTVLRPEDTIRLAVRLESSYPQVTRYMVVVSTNGRQDTEESIVLGIDFLSSDSCCTVGLVLPLWSDTLIHLDGDGGFSVSTVNRVHIFKPVSVQAMWSALQSLHKACEVARCHNHYPGSLFMTWISYYQSRISSSQLCINEWNAMQDVESHRSNSPVPFIDVPTERERTEKLIKMRLREIMMQKDLENVTCKEIRTELEMQMVCNLREFKEFIDTEMLVILGQMDSPTEIFDHVYLGSEWNASNLEELQSSGVRYILNVTREIDNFFPGMFEYHNIRVYDQEATNLLEYWNDTYKFITKAKKAGAKCLVHCKMGVSRSASTVIAYAMKEYGWDLDTAFDYVKEKRSVTKPNPSFMKQLEEYQGILLASKQRHNKLWRSHSDSDLSDHPESICKTPSHPNSNNNNTSPASLQHFLGVAVLQALGAEPQNSAESESTHTSESHAEACGQCESEVQQEVSSECEDLLLLPLPTPQAATLVPEEGPDNSASVAVTVPVAVLPHPPPSLHILPPTPELQRVRRSPPRHLSLLEPQPKPEELSLSLQDRGSSEEISPLTLGSSGSDLLDQSSSELTSDKHSPLSLTDATPPPLVLPLLPSDDNNNPSPLDTAKDMESRRDPDGSSNHSEDCIDFLSARERFLGLSQDGKIGTQSEQSLQREEIGEMDDKDEEEQENKSQVSPLSEGSDDAANDQTPQSQDKSISVRHIVTEIEAINHPPPVSSSPPLLPPSLSPQLTPVGHQEKSEPKDSLSPLPHPPSPSVLPCDWPVGSVRRATEQLEQKLRQQEVEISTSQRSPLHSPSAEHPPARLSLSPSPCCARAQPPPPGSPSPSTQHRSTQGEITDLSAPSTDGENHTGSKSGTQRPHPSGTNEPPEPLCSLNSSNNWASGVEPITVETPERSHMLTSSLASTSESAEQSPVLKTPPQDCTVQMSLDGVTLQESHTDETPPAAVSRGKHKGCVPGCEAQNRLARGSQELHRIQQTLRELQEFLHKGTTLQMTDGAAEELEQPQGQRHVMDSEPGPCRRTGSKQSPADSLELEQRPQSRHKDNGLQRAMDLEARIRQAGLTPPSLMKRSASLAKLDCLELSTHDLSDLDLRPHTRTTSTLSQDSIVSSTLSHPDDSWKKQKVLTGNICAQKTCATGDETLAQLSSGARRPKETTTDREDVTASRQQGRGHSARRSRKTSAEKKPRATAVLYNTM